MELQCEKCKHVFADNEPLFNGNAIGLELYCTYCWVKLCIKLHYHE